jgi:tRNA(Ile)-lysidine synthase TilS/MesJ
MTRPRLVHVEYVIHRQLKSTARFRDLLAVRKKDLEKTAQKKDLPVLGKELENLYFKPVRAKNTACLIVL